MPRAGAYRRAWRHRRWRWLLASLLVSVSGDFLYFVALVTFLVERTGSAAWIGGAAVARLLVYVFLSPIGGVLADRFDRQRMMVVLDVARFVVMTTIAVVVWADGPPAVVVGLTMCSSLASVPYRPAAVTATPALVPEDDLAAANAAESTAVALAVFAGPAVGAVIVAWSNPGAAFLVNGLTFLAAAGCVSRIGDIGGRRSREAAAMPAGHDALEASPDAAGPLRTMLTDVREGVGHIRRDGVLLALTVIGGAGVFQLGAEQVLDVFVVTDRLGRDPASVGVLGAAMGVGAMAVAPFTARLGERWAAPMLAGSAALMGVMAAALGIAGSMPFALAAMFLIGVGSLVGEVLAVTLLQRACPEDALARVYGLQDSVAALAQLVGSVLAPWLLGRMSVRGALLVIAVVVVVAIVSCTPALLRGDRQHEAERRRLAPTVERLRSLGILGDAGQAALERIARGAAQRHLSAGEVVFEEGDPAEDLFVIVRGTFSVTTRRQGEVNTMGPGDWFGEIGLLREVPRTATVTTTGPAEVLVVPGSLFVNALESAVPWPEPLGRTMRTRLLRTDPHLVLEH